MLVGAALVVVLTTGDAMAQMGLTAVYISHDLALVRYLCERTLVMYLGRVVEDAPTEEIVRRPRHPYTQALVAAVPVPDPDLQKTRERILLPGDPPSPINPPSGCRFHPRCSHAMEVCVTVKPEPTPISAEHWVACHWAAEQLAGKSGGPPGAGAAPAAKEPPS